MSLSCSKLLTAIEKGNEKEALDQLFKCDMNVAKNLPLNKQQTNCFISSENLLQSIKSF